MASGRRGAGPGPGLRSSAHGGRLVAHRPAHARSLPLAGSLCWDLRSAAASADAVATLPNAKAQHPQHHPPRRAAAAGVAPALARAPPPPPPPPQPLPPPLLHPPPLPPRCPLPATTGVDGVGARGPAPESVIPSCAPPDARSTWHQPQAQPLPPQATDQRAPRPTCLFAAAGGSARRRRRRLRRPLLAAGLAAGVAELALLLILLLLVVRGRLPLLHGAGCERGQAPCSVKRHQAPDQACHSIACAPAARRRPQRLASQSPGPCSPLVGVWGPAQRERVGGGRPSGGSSTHPGSPASQQSAIRGRW